MDKHEMTTIVPFLPDKVKTRVWAFCVLSIFACVQTCLAAGAGKDEGQQERPNILLIVADDMGYADLGIHGSSIRTPRIDGLARKGVIFSQFHTAPMCSPTRSMLLSGNNNHVAGIGRQHPSPSLKGKIQSYEGYLSDRIAPLPALLKAAGYHTYIAGKWHLGSEDENSPRAAGFERSWTLLDGAATHFDDRGFENEPNVYRADGEITKYPAGAYSTAFYTDRLIEFIESNRGDGQPFFGFAAYTSPHWPLQVPGQELDRYAGGYDDGYDVLRGQNFVNLKKAGIIPENSNLPPRWDEITPWDDLTAEEKKIESRKMELYAAMVENLDGHVGRLLDYLEAKGLAENTLVVFMSDNGAAPSDFYNRGPYVDYIQAHFDNRYENMGGPDSFVSYGAAWAEAGSAPFKRHKGYTSEGGITAPMIIAGHGVKHRDEVYRGLVTVMDLAPTFIGLANAHYPDDGSVQPMRGKSIEPILGGASGRVHDENEVFVLFHRNQAYVRQGQWKITHIETPFEEAGFELYDLDADPGETTDLSQQFPEKRAELIELWRQQRLDLGIILPSDL
jgi:arylsulfatase